MKRITLKMIFNRYLKDNNEKDILIKSKLELILADYFNEIKKEILEGRVYKPSSNFGMFGIIKKKTSKKPINWKETKKAGHYVYIENNHTDGFSFNFIWGKKLNRHLNIRFKNMAIYKMKTLYTFSKQINSLINDKSKNPMLENFSVSKYI